MSEASQLVRYDAMCSAIAAAYDVDEVAEIRDQAFAMELYMRQRHNVEAERRVCEIRLRAEKKLGQLISKMDRAPGKRDGEYRPTSVQAEPRLALSETLKRAGISETQAKRWQKLAAIPEPEFEATFARADRKPSTSGIIAAHQAKAEPPPEPVVAAPQRKPVRPDALWLWGRLLDFERDGILKQDPDELFDSMLDHMKETTRELMPVVIAWMGRMSL